MRTHSAARLVAAVALAVALAACNSAPVATLTDPREIATRASGAMQAVKAIHARYSVSGSVVSADGKLGPGSGPGSYRLDGTTGQIWFDTQTENVRLTFDAPGFANSSGEVIRVGGDVYVKASGGAGLLTGQNGTKYVKYPLSSAPVPLPSVGSPAASGSSGIEGAVGKWLAGPGLVLLGVEKKNGRDSYHLRTTAPPDQLSSGTDIGLDLTAVVVDVWVAVDNQQLSHLQITANGSTGSATVAADLDYPNGVSIQAPPPDQVATPS